MSAYVYLSGREVFSHNSRLYNKEPKKFTDKIYTYSDFFTFITRNKLPVVSGTTYVYMNMLPFPMKSGSPGDFP
jgi:hypothetical protein